MSQEKAVYVGCYCGWRSRRKPGECACYDEWMLYCRCRWGTCPKCKGTVRPVYWMNEMDRTEKETEEFWKRHAWVDGKIVEVSPAGTQRGGRG